MNPATVTLRPALPPDQPFLAAVYASTREEELAPVPWTAEQKRAFLQSQFELQQRSYREHFPDAAFQVVQVDGVPAGRLYVDMRADEIRIVDLALLPPFRGRGIGSGLLRDEITRARAAGRPLSVHVEMHNRARSLYERLGFRPVAEHGAYTLLVLAP